MTIKFHNTYSRTINHKSNPSILSKLLKTVELSKKKKKIIVWFTKFAHRLLLSSIYLSVVIVIIVDLILYSSDKYNLVSLAGIGVYVVIMFIFSVKPSKV